MVLEGVDGQSQEVNITKVCCMKLSIFENVIKMFLIFKNILKHCTFGFVKCHSLQPYLIFIIFVQPEFVQYNEDTVFLTAIHS